MVVTLFGKGNIIFFRDGQILAMDHWKGHGVGQTSGLLSIQLSLV
jgi:hypothetical protein